MSLAPSLSFAWHSLARRLSGCVLILCGLALGVAPAAADDRLAATGYYAEIGAGAAVFVGSAGTYSEVGPSFELRSGYDLFSWLSIGLTLSGATHEAVVPPPPEGEYFQVYGAAADGRLGIRFGAIGLFVDGGAGLGMMSSNILERVAVLEPGERFSLLLRAGGGVEYQVRNRHYAFGLAGQWISLPQFDASQGVTTRLYLRYTY